MSRLESYYAASLGAIVQETMQSCPSLTKSVRGVREEFLAYARQVAAALQVDLLGRSLGGDWLGAFTPVHESLVLRWQRKVVDGLSQCSRWSRPVALLSAATAFLDQEWARNELLKEVDASVAAVVAAQGEAHAEAVERLARPYRVDLQMKVLSSTDLSTDTVEHLEEVLRGHVSRIEEKLGPLSRYKHGGASRAAWNATLAEYARGDAANKRLGADLNVGKYFGGGGLDSLQEDTGKTNSGALRVYDARVLDRVVQLYTMGVPARAGFSQTQGVASNLQQLATMGKLYDAGQMSMREWNEMFSEVDWVLPVLKAKAKEVALALRRGDDAKLPRVPIRVAQVPAQTYQRTDYGFLDEVLGSPLVSNRYKTSIQKAEDHRNELGELGTFLALPPITAEEAAALRREQGVPTDMFTLSGRLRNGQGTRVAGAVSRAVAGDAAATNRVRGPQRDCHARKRRAEDAEDAPTVSSGARVMLRVHGVFTVCSRLLEQRAQRVGAGAARERSQGCQVLRVAVPAAGGLLQHFVDGVLARGQGGDVLTERGGGGPEDVDLAGSRSRGRLAAWAPLGRRAWTWHRPGAPPSAPWLAA